ncbi:4'-phosphopantetheinyl transferase family protein [Streptacidiphilus albus]|uniref:4'-phosphopantetheinyl transferase family protein n=1 Tax=Streptacidiphilus albus TaxID=105425 RepID=UPI00068AEE6F|nr:4'-phosphopantetheinyl transferase superfamily protein [Streptacidiphilus albus]
MADAGPAQAERVLTERVLAERVLAELTALAPRLAALGAALGLARVDEPAAPRPAPGEAALAAPMHPTRRREFLAGRRALHRAMATAGLPPAEVLRDGRRPLLPEGCAASISHSGGLAVALAGPGPRLRALGCDLELHALPLAAAHLVLGPGERARLRTVADPATAERDLLATFSAKEAAFKAFSALLPGDRAPSLLLDLTAAPVPGGLRVRSRRHPSAAVHVHVHPTALGVFTWTAVPG